MSAHASFLIIKRVEEKRKKARLVEQFILFFATSLDFIYHMTPKNT